MSMDWVRMLLNLFCTGVTAVEQGYHGLKNVLKARGKPLF
jgi:hypothetical protein